MKDLCTEERVLQQQKTQQLTTLKDPTMSTYRGARESIVDVPMKECTVWVYTTQVCLFLRVTVPPSLTGKREGAAKDVGARRYWSSVFDSVNSIRTVLVKISLASGLSTGLVYSATKSVYYTQFCLTSPCPDFTNVLQEQERDA
ncbi:hypothetical protein cyc_02758 [Cyclospora cayetanensis]|uniref:Uncharacterized protein n=1 Tax=Cyclospora cayetanensis TaxID=88456 RepID=A0A1D3CWY4_9EIME|nr:hypothetical protein cyc_02758 [Cyclospora cayetanensis]